MAETRTWTCTLTAEQFQLFKDRIPLYIDFMHENTKAFPQGKYPADIDVQAWHDAMQVHDRIDTHILNEWLKTATQDGTTVTAHILWEEPALCEEWPKMIQIDRVWRTVREVAVSELSSHLGDADVFRTIRALTLAVTAAEIT